MLLSFIIPVYNVEAFVGFCLQSILSDPVDADSFEVIIINDGSKDQSMSVVRKICAGHENIHILDQNNQGLSAARMNGMKKAQGKYVWFIDSDDWLKAGSVCHILSLLERIEPDVIVTPLHWRYKDGRKDFFDITITEDKHYLGKDYLSESLLPVWAAPRYIIKKDFLKNNTWINFPLNTLHEDEYFGRVLLYSARFVYVHRNALYNYRQHENSIMSSISIKNAFDLVKLHKLLKRFLKTHVLPENQLWFRQNIFKNFLLTNYYHRGYQFGGKDFNRFLFNNRGYIIWEYVRAIPNKTPKKVIGDIAFLFAPFLYTKYKSLRYID